MTAIALTPIGTFSHRIEESWLREMAEAYAKAYNADSGDTVEEFCLRASFDVMPANYGTTRARRAFRNELMMRIKNR